MSRYSSIKLKIENLYKHITWYEDLLIECKKRNADLVATTFYLHWMMTGEYFIYFDQAEKMLNRKPTVYDYHCLYTWIIDVLETYFLDLLIMNDENNIEADEEIISNNNILDAYRKETLKIQLLFEEYAAKAENTTPENMGEIAEILDKKKQADIDNTFKDNLFYIDIKQSHKNIYDNIISKYLILFNLMKIDNEKYPRLIFKMKLQEVASCLKHYNNYELIQKYCLQEGNKINIRSLQTLKSR